MVISNKCVFHYQGQSILSSEPVYISITKLSSYFIIIKLHVFPDRLQPF